MGTDRKLQDDELGAALALSKLFDMAARLGGLDGQVAEGVRDLTSTERTRVYLARRLIARPELALVDADEVGMDGNSLTLLLDHFRKCQTTTLFVTSERIERKILGRPLVLTKAVLPMRNRP